MALTEKHWIILEYLAKNEKSNVKRLKRELKLNLSETSIRAYLFELRKLGLVSDPTYHATQKGKRTYQTFKHCDKEGKQALEAFKKELEEQEAAGQEVKDEQV